MVTDLWVLVEDLIRWQQINAAMDAAGFMLIGAVLAWCVVKIRRLEGR